MTAPADTDLMRAEGIEKMARAMAYSDGIDPDDWMRTTRIRYLESATAALATWEAHIAAAWPTPEMCAAGSTAIMDSGIGDFHGKDTGGYHTISARLNSEEAATVFRAMMAAAQKKSPGG